MRFKHSLILIIGVTCTATTTVLAQATASHVVHIAPTIIAPTVHISPTTMEADSLSIQIGAKQWSVRGLDLKTLIAEVYDVDARLVDLPATVDTTARYDVSLARPNDASPEDVQQLLRQAIEKNFHLEIATENRSMEVYLLTAPNGPGAAIHRHTAATRDNGLYRQASLTGQSADEAQQQITFAGKQCSGAASSGISATEASLAEFARTLNPELDRLLVDDTRLSGSFDFRVGIYHSQQELFQRLRDELGLVVVPAQRQMAVLTVRPAA